MKDVNPAEDQNAFNDETGTDEQIRNCKKGQGCDVPLRICPEPVIEGWVVGTLADAIQDLNDDEVRKLYRNIKKRNSHKWM